MIHQAKRISFLWLCFNLFFLIAPAQTTPPVFTRADTLRGSLNEERRYDVLKYEISFTPDYLLKSITGSNTITYRDSGQSRISSPDQTGIIQIDLMEPLEVDSIIQNGEKLTWQREGSVFHVNTTVESTHKKQTGESCKFCIRKLTVYYHGNPQIAATPPWGNGGFIFTKDAMGRPWISVACQGYGASVWYPCKDYLGDEPDSGASLTITVPDSLVAVGNGRLIKKSKPTRDLTSWTWAVTNPINNYNIVPYIGKYTSWHKTYYGQKGNLDCDFWVLDYDLKKARKHFIEVDSMLSCFELWFGPYPFYEDSYKLVEAPYLGMEHQSDIAYGNHFKQGIDGRDLSGTGWGLKWDYIIVHESGHEWFGNNISCKDLADQWIHESFTDYCETLYTGNYFGKAAGDAYSIGNRNNIMNRYPIIRYYGVNKEPEGNDQYHKGASMIHNIRQVIHNDEIFRRIMRGLNQNFYHQTVTALDIQDYINKISGIDFTPVFNQYLRATAIPVLEYKFENKSMLYRWANCNPDFNMPVRVDIAGERWLKPTTEWKKERLPKNANLILQVDKNFYVTQNNLTVNP